MVAPAPNLRWRRGWEARCAYACKELLASHTYENFANERRNTRNDVVFAPLFTQSTRMEIYKLTRDAAKTKKKPTKNRPRKQRPFLSSPLRQFPNLASIPRRRAVRPIVLANVKKNQFFFPIRCSLARHHPL